MSDFIIHGNSLEDIADAIREKTGTSSPIAVGDMPDLIYGISGGEGHELYTVDNLLVNTTYSVTSGTSNVTKQYSLTGSIDDYDAVMVMAWCYNTGTVQSNLMSSIIFAKDYYQRAIDSGSSANNPWLLNATANTARRSIAFQFDDATHITTVSLRTESGVEPVLYKVEGIKFGRDVDHKEDTLWSGTLSVVGDVTLEHSINDYDEINVKWHCNNTSGVYTKYIKILVDDIDYTKVGQFCDSTQIIASSSNYNAFISCYFKNSTTFNFSEKYAGSGFTPVIDEIIGIKYGGFNANTPFDMEQIFQESPTVTLTNNTLNTVKTITVEDEGYYFLSFIDRYDRSSNRSYLVVTGIQDECLIYNFGSYNGTDVLSDVSGYSWFAHTIMFRTFVPNTTVTLGLWGNGYSPNSVKITLYKFKGMSVGSNVVANPEGTPTEDLNTIQIGDTVYNIAGSGGGGGSLKTYHADWTATSSSASGTQLTQSVELPKGKYLINAYSPYSTSSNNAYAYAIDKDGVPILQTIITAPVSYGRIFTYIELESDASIYLASATSPSVTWDSQYLDRGGLDAISLEVNGASGIIDYDNVIFTDSYTTTSASYDYTYTATEDCFCFYSMCGGANQDTHASIWNNETMITTIASIYNGTLLQQTFWCFLSKGKTLKVHNTYNGAQLSIRVFGMKIIGGGGGTANIWSGTQEELEEEFEDIPEGTQIVVYDDMEEIESGGEYYATDERCIGTWTDNKPLYQKTVIIGSLPSTTYTAVNYPHNIANIDKICEWTGLMRLSTGSTQLMPTIQFNNNSVNLAGCNFAYIDKTNINVIVGTDRSSAEGIFTIKYTKTTDSPVPLATKVMPSYEVYSTGEQIIGQWFDGKILYRQPFTLSASLSISNISWTDSGFDLPNGQIKKAFIIRNTDSGQYFPLVSYVNNNNVYLETCWGGSTLEFPAGSIIVLEYTKSS